MAELELGHPDELLERLTNWLNEANDSIGSLPPNLTPTEWVVRNFIGMWRKPIRAGLDSIEESLNKALTALKSGDVKVAVFEIECSLQTLGEDIRDELGLYDLEPRRHITRRCRRTGASVASLLVRTAAERQIVRLHEADHARRRGNGNR